MTEVAEIMSTPVFVVSARDNIARARNLMLMDGGDLKGIVTKKDIALRLNQSEPQWRRRPLDQVPVELVMTHDTITVPPKMEIQEAASLMLCHRISDVLVYDGGVQGIVTKHDMVKYFALLGCPLKVGDMMTSKVITVSRHHTINSVIDIMAENEVDRVVVVDGGVEANSYVGLITLDDLGLVEIDPRNKKPITEVHKGMAAGPKMFYAIRQTMLVAEDVMSTPLTSVTENTPALEAAKIMIEHNYDMLPVIDDKLRGEFTYENIMEWLSEAKE
jgi:CBS domain-containing protein